MNPKQLYKRWKVGMTQITPVQQLHAKMVGHIGGVLGLILAVIVLLYKGIWYFALFLAAMIWLQWWEFKGARKRYIEMTSMMEEIKNEKQATIESR